MKPHPLIHRDVKPQNVLFVHGYRVVKLADFGSIREQPDAMIADMVDAESVNEQNNAMTGNVGTASYMAPEVCVA